MAGEWQKWTKTLPAKPEVIQMAAALKIDRYSVAGRLMAVWGWVDDNSTDGCHVPGVTNVTVRALVDDLSGVTGFADAMLNVHWLEVFSDHIEFPNGERHNGETAKTRALSAERKARQRSRESHDASVTKTGPEKRREEKNKNTPLPPLPEKLSTPEFSQAFARWVQHRQEIKHAIKPTQAATLLRKLEQWGPSRAIAAIDHSIANGWQGLFEPDTPPKPPVSQGPRRYND